MNSLKRIFVAPVFEDEIKTQQAHMLNVIVWTLICVPIPFVIYSLFRIPENVTRALIQATFGETVNIILLIMLRRGLVRAASIIQVSTFWLFFTATALTGNGVQGEAYLLGYGLVIAIAGILLGGTGALIFTCLSLMAGGFMVFQEMRGAFEPYVESMPLTTWIVSLVLFPVGAVLQYLGSHTVRNSLARAHISEERYRLISRVSSDYTFSTELDFEGNMRLNWVAGAFDSMTGYTYDEYVALGGWLAHLHPDDVEKDAQALAKLKNNQQAIHEVRTYAKDKKLLWVRVYAHPVWDEKQNRLIGIVGAVQDITERKLSEAALKYERDLLQTFMDNIPDSVYFKDTESRFVRINKAQAQFLNLNDPQEAIGKTDLDFQRPELAKQFMEEEKQIVETGQAVINRIEFNPTADGKPRWISATKVLAKDSAGRLIGTIGVSRDVTEQKESEEKLQKIFLQQAAILNNIPDMAWLKDRDSRYIAVNEQFAKRVGMRMEDIAEKTDLEVWQNSYAERYRKDDLEVMQTRQRRNAEELEIDNMGNEYWVETSKTPILNAEGEVIGTTGIARDITERKKAELERQTLVDELESKNAELERFTYTVSHDLKSPLVTITGFLGYLEQDAISGNFEKVKGNINRISSAARKMQALLNDLLELSRIGRIMNTPENIPFKEIVYEAVDLVRGKLDEINAIVEIQKDLPVVKGDRTRLVEVVQNLIDNAAKYSNPESRSHIEIGTKMAGENQTVFYVRDNGIGIAAKYHENIFGLFNKLNATSEGTGIGLTLVKRIIEVHGGHIWVESEAGNGATFYFTLPNKQIKE